MVVSQCSGFKSLSEEFSTENNANKYFPCVFVVSGFLSIFFMHKVCLQRRGRILFYGVKGTKLVLQLLAQHLNLHDLCCGTSFGTRLIKSYQKDYKFTNKFRGRKRFYEVNGTVLFYCPLHNAIALNFTC